MKWQTELLFMDNRTRLRQEAVLFSRKSQGQISALANNAETGI